MVNPLLEPLMLGNFEDNAELFAAVESLPGDLTVELQKGPVTGPHKHGECCRVCMAIDLLRDPVVDSRWADHVSDELVDVALKLWDFHQGRDLVEYGLKAGEGDVCFERCKLIYQAAGWTEEQRAAD